MALYHYIDKLTVRLYCLTLPAYAKHIQIANNNRLLNIIMTSSSNVQGVLSMGVKSCYLLETRAFCFTVKSIYVYDTLGALRFRCDSSSVILELHSLIVDVCKQMHFFVFIMKIHVPTRREEYSYPMDEGVLEHNVVF